MTPVYRDIIKHASIYGFGQILARMASILLLPLYTHCLTPADFGIVAILDVTTGMLSILIGSGMAIAVSRYHFDARDETEQDRVWWTGLTFVAILATAIVVPLWLVRDWLATLTLFRTPMSDGAFYYALALPTLWFGVIGELPVAHLRVRKWSVLSVSMGLVRLFLSVALNVYFLAVLQLGIVGLLTGNLIASACMTVMHVTILAHSRGKYAFDRLLMGKLWRFGSPLIITSLLATLMHEGDRYVLNVYLDQDRVGIYSLAYRISQAVNTLCLAPFGFIWSVLVYEINGQSNDRQIFADVFKYYSHGLLLVLLSASLFAKPIITLITTEAWSDAAALIPILLLSLYFFSLHNHFRVPVLLDKSTKTLLPVFLAGAVINIAVNFAVIPFFGLYGAAWASVLTYGSFSFLGLWRYRRIQIIPYAFGECAAVLMGMVGTYLILQLFVRTHLEEWQWMLAALGALIVWSVVLFGPVAWRAFRATRSGTLPVAINSSETVS